MNPTRMQCFVLLVGALCCQLAAARGGPPVGVKVLSRPAAGQTIYRYRVINGGTQPITALQIGFDNYRGQPELRTAPSGSRPGMVAPAAASSPPVWTAELNATEDSPDLDLEWTAATAAQAIPPGGSLSGFSVTVPGNDPSYVHSHWTVSLNGSGAPAYSATLEADAPGG